MNRRRIRISFNVAHQNSRRQRTWPKPKEIPTEMTEEHEQKPTADRFPVHSECVRAGQSLIDFSPSQPYHTVVSLGRYRSPGGEIPFLASTIEMNHEIAAMAEYNRKRCAVEPFWSAFYA